MPQNFLVTAREAWSISSADDYHEWIVGPPGQYGERGWRMAQRGISVAAERRPAVVAQGASPAIAYVNHGRWVADCPTGCGGAMLVLFDAPFLCGNCFNADIQGRYRPLAAPDALHRSDIAAALVSRRRAEEMNWHPGQSVADLEAENAELGL